MLCTKCHKRQAVVFISQTDGSSDTQGLCLVCAKELGIKSNVVTLLEHMVLSHHGVPEFGSPTRPMFLEAVILSKLDDLDATVFEINNATSKVEPDTFTDRQWALDNRKLYNHGLSTTKHTVNFGE